MGLRLLRIPDECLDKVHVLLDHFARDALALELLDEVRPRRVDVGGRETFLRVVAHVRDVLERTCCRP